ncbi:MAG: TRAP transporter permease [Candidatus Desulforudis sp.]|nr:TRAP transporter permease [Desulforudis sp.]
MPGRRKNGEHQPRIDAARETGEVSRRSVTGFFALLLLAVCLAMSLFHLYTAGFGVLEAMKQRSVHLSFALVLAFLAFPFSRQYRQKTIPVYDLILALLALTCTKYVFVNYQDLMYRGGKPTTTDLVAGAVCILLVLEATRRVVGKPLVILAGLFLIYGYYGPYMPGRFAHRGADIPRIIDHLYLGTEGLFGIPLGVSATYIIIFILFGTFLQVTGAGRMFIELALGLFGWMRGGPAKAAVVASGMMGSISGSSVANAVTTGTFTIPLMKKVGFKPHVAGGVEVAASSSGQLMPPVMGAAAFIMVEYTGIPYVEIIKAAAVPCILSYSAILIMVHLEAVKSGIKGLPREELPPVKQLLLERGYMLLPFFVLIYMLVIGFTPLKAGYYAILFTISLAVFTNLLKLAHKEVRGNWRALLVPALQTAFRLGVQALEIGARNCVGVALACATAGIIIGIVTLSGLGLKLSSIIVQAAGGHLWLTLIYTMIGSMILGMGLPTTGTYIILAAITAPALVHVGVPLLAAHLFVFYFGILADDTPPINLPAYATSGLAGANPVQTGVTGFKFDCGALMLPYIFATNSALLLINTDWLGAVHAILAAFLGIVALTSAIQNYLFTYHRIWERLLLFTAAVVLVHLSWHTDAIGLGLILLVAASQKLRLAKSAVPTPASGSVKEG